MFSALEAWVVICGLDVFVPDVMLVSVLRIELGDVDSPDDEGGIGVEGTEGFEVTVVGCDAGLEGIESDVDDREMLERAGKGLSTSALLSASMCGLGVALGIGVPALLAAA